LIRDKKGTFYGVTLYGGASDYGTVFKLDTKMHHTVLYSFTGRNGDGEYPRLSVARRCRQLLWHCHLWRPGRLWKWLGMWNGLRVERIRQRDCFAPVYRR